MRLDALVRQVGAVGGSVTEGQRRDLEQRVRQLQDEQKALRDLALERKRQLTKGLSQRHVRHRYVYITIEDNVIDVEQE